MAHTDATNCRIKELDLHTAKLIAGFAGVPTHDSQHMLRAEVWTRAGDNGQMTSVLINSHDVKKMCLESLQAQINANQDLIAQSDPATTAQWAFEHAAKWENMYQQHQRQHDDISMGILSIMHETVHEVQSVLEDSGFSMQHVREAWLACKQQEGYLQDEQDAITRFLFRAPPLRHVLIMIAGKILQKRTICNRAGIYATKEQRKGVIEELDQAYAAFCTHVEEDARTLDEWHHCLEGGEASTFFTDHTSPQGRQ